MSLCIACIMSTKGHHLFSGNFGRDPVFAGVSVQTFIEYIKAGESIESFLEGFPSVTREQVFCSFWTKLKIG